MKTHKLFSTIPFLIITLFIFSCTAPTIEEQVERLMQTEDADKRDKIAESLANSMDVQAAKMIKELLPNHIAVEASNKMMQRYDELITQTLNISQVQDCISDLLDPFLGENERAEEEQMILILSGLKRYGGNEDYRSALINSAKKHGELAMEQIIAAFYEETNEFRREPLLHTIRAFDETAFTYLSDHMNDNPEAVDLLAQIGQPVVNFMIEKMKDDDFLTRFTAGDVLVRMIEYDPAAVEELTSALSGSNEGLSMIANSYPFYIRLGRDGSEELLLSALDHSFSEKMCLDMMNCGNRGLENGAVSIAENRGYIVESKIGSHDGPKWGSHR